jgi:PAS domain S-box-containing protein
MGTSGASSLGYSSALRDVLLAVAAAAGYAASGWLSYRLALNGGPYVLMWAPAGLMLGVLLRVPRRLWWPLLAGGAAGCFALELYQGTKLPFPVLAALANTFESLAAAWIVSRCVRLPLTLTTLRDVTVLLLGAAVASNAATSLAGAVVLDLFGGTTFLEGWLLWWTGDGLAIIVLAPPVIVWSQWRSVARFATGARAEAVILATGLTLTCELIFNWQSLFGAPLHPRPYLTLPFLYWAAFRFGPLGATGAACLIAGEALWHSSAGLGPFATGTAPNLDRLVDAYLFLSIATVSGLIMAAVLAERRTAEQSLREAEARTRTLVEHAPDALLVFDVDRNRLVDVNENAIRLLGRSREELLEIDPRAISPPVQPDGRRSADAAGRYAQEALAGGTPVFEWTMVDAMGRDILTEVRLVRLPSSRPL